MEKIMITKISKLDLIAMETVITAAASKAFHSKKKNSCKLMQLHS